MHREQERWRVASYEGLYGYRTPFLAFVAARARPAVVPSAAPTRSWVPATVSSAAHLHRLPHAAAEGWGSEIMTVDVAKGKMLLDSTRYKFLDLRDAKAYDMEHLTKPARCSVSVPFVTDRAAFIAAARKAVASMGTPLLVADAAGAGEAMTAAQWLGDAGYQEVLVVQGGYTGWRERYTTSGRNTPPKGRWVSTGTEALKSGLNVGNVAASYEEQLNVEDLTKKNLQPISPLPDRR